MGETRRLVIYHADCVDGFTAAWVAWTLYGDAADYVPAHYGDAPPDVRGRDVLIVDFSYPRAVLEDLHAAARSLRVLDHHKTAQEALAGLPWAEFDLNRSGAGLTWDLLRGPEPRPALVDFVEDRDLWRWVLPQSREVSAYIATVERDLDEWGRLAARLEQEAHVGVIVRGGAIALRVLEQHVERQYFKALRAEIGGYFVPFINCTFGTSELVGALAVGEPFACGWFQREDGRFQYSLRARPSEIAVDVSAIAKEVGGGGHSNAAGFELEHLLPSESVPSNG